MVDIIRRKNVNLQSPDVSSGAKATANMVQKIGTGIGSAMENYGKKVEKRQAEDREYQTKVEENLYKAQEKIKVDEQKAFDAADKMVAADMAGRLKNDLLRWNISQRENNPEYIGTAEHEKRMRDEYARLSSVYGKGLGEAGREEFQNKTQSAVNDFISNDVKWAYRQKIKQGEESAKKAAQALNETAGMYGANGDIEGFKEAHKEGRKKLKEYIDETAPAGAAQALKELDRKSLIDFYTNLAQTDPVKAKALLDSMENFQTTVPDDMLQAANDTTTQAVNRDLNDKLILVNAGIENTKKDRKQQKELEKQKKQIEKDIKKAQEEDYTEKSLGEIHKEVSDAVKPVLEKSLGESALIAKKEHEEEKVARFGEFLKLPTPQNLKFFEEDNQMSYAKPEENMSKLPDDFFSYGDQSTLKDYYDMYKGRYADKQKEKRTLLKAGIANAPKNSQERADLERKKEKLEEEMANEDKTILSNASTKDLERIDKLVSGGMSEEKAVEKVFNETEAEIQRKAKQRRANELLENMMKYRENFGNVSMVEISDYKGTKQMFDDLNNLAQCKIDEDGNCNEILNGALTTLNNAKEHNVSEADYNNLQNITNNVINNPDYKAQTQYTMALAKANILDHYADLFNEPEYTEMPMVVRGLSGLSGVEFGANKAKEASRQQSKEKDLEKLVGDIASGKVKRRWIFDVNTDYGKFSSDDAKLIESVLDEEKEASSEIKRIDNYMVMGGLSKQEAFDKVYEQQPGFWGNKDSVANAYEQSKTGNLDKALRDLSMNKIRKDFRGDIRKEFEFYKGKKGTPEFNYSEASEKNRKKYNLVKDTYLNVMNDMAGGDFDSANNKIFELPYNVAYINYEGKVAPDLIKKFIQHDKTGDKPVEFMYNGYSFEYLGIDPTGTIKAKRRL